MSDVATKDDVRDMREVVLEEMRLGFQGVYQRQDKTNGRLLAVEERSTETKTKVKGLEHEVFERPHRATASPRDRRHGITQRDLAIVMGTIGAMWAGLKALAWLIPFLKVGLS